MLQSKINPSNPAEVGEPEESNGMRTRLISFDTRHQETERGGIAISPNISGEKAGYFCSRSLTP